jgi:tRNA threonylcarbamoyladenosine biosynthesis protein TsaB
MNPGKKRTASNNHPLLMLDASSPVIQVGILLDHKWVAFYHSEKEALQSIFQGTDFCLKKTGMDINAVKGFLFCEGPGATLGIRIAAMAIQGWKSMVTLRKVPVYAYSSLKAAAAVLLFNEGGGLPWSIISDCREGLWNFYSIRDGQTVITDDILKDLQGTIFYLRHRKIRYQLPCDNVIDVDYLLKKSPDIFLRSELLRKQDDPTPFTSVSMQYKKWNYCKGSDRSKKNEKK